MRVDVDRGQCDEDETVKALTLHQPFAWAIAVANKRVENRDWPPPKGLVGQHLAIHAGKKYDLKAAEEIRTDLGLVVPTRKEITQAAIVAVAVIDRIWDSADDSPGWDDPWFVGAFGWVLRDVVRIDPVPCKGAQKLWEVPAPVLERVRANWREAKRAA